MSLKITYLKFYSNLPVAKELIHGGIQHGITGLNQENYIGKTLLPNRQLDHFIHVVHL